MYVSESILTKIGKFRARIQFPDDEESDVHLSVKFNLSLAFVKDLGQFAKIIANRSRDLHGVCMCVSRRPYWFA